MYYLIICRSLTYAQRTAAVLERVGISTRILRAPKAVAQEGCSHAVRVAQHQLNGALMALKRADMTPARVFLGEKDGSFQEVLF